MSKLRHMIYQSSEIMFQDVIFILFSWNEVSLFQYNL